MLVYQNISYLCIENKLWIIMIIQSDTLNYHDNPKYKAEKKCITGSNYL